MARKPKTALNLALQGGGAHGAFTWGVLDWLLQHGNFRFDTISATSAGAVNAVAMVSGLVAGSANGARTKLREIWDTIVDSAPPDLTQLNPLFAGFGRMEAFGGPSMAQMAGLMSPFAFNPFDYNPLRKLLEQRIDFAAIREQNEIELLIAATDSRTGQAKLFRRSELTADMVLASACLPMLYRAVAIDGRAYWDGGFSANPDIVTLAREAAARDTLLVLLTPPMRSDMPARSLDILSQINRITFGQPLIRDVREILSIREASAGPQAMLVPRERKRVAQHRFHLIEAGAHTEQLPEATRLRPDRATTDHLFEAGRREAEIWLTADGKHVGKQESIDLALRLLPEPPLAAANDG